jgi:hypothetical protein
MKFAATALVKKNYGADSNLKFKVSALVSFYTQIACTALIKNKISISGNVINKISAVVQFNTLVVSPICTPYDLIDAGLPSTIYTPINGFNLISGGNP